MTSHVVVTDQIVPASPSENDRNSEHFAWVDVRHLDGAARDAVVQAAGCLAPAVEISADTFAGDAPLSVQFASAISAVSGCVDSLLWNFGDGDTSTSENPSHTFDAGGEYIVTLVVQGQGGSGSDSVTIDVFGAGDDDDDDTGGCGQ